MIWIIFSLINAFFESIKDVFIKKGVSHINEYIVAWGSRFFGVLFLLPILLIGIPDLNSKYWISLFIQGSLLTITSILYVKALKYSNLSKVAPILSFTPLFLLMFSPIILNEFPGPLGLIGVLFIVMGSYMLNSTKAKHGLLDPFKSLFQDKGSRYMLIVSFIWAFMANIDKIGVQNSSPLFWVFSVNLVLSITLLPIALIKSKNFVKSVQKNALSLAPIGLANALSIGIQMYAITMTIIPYAIAIKRTSTLFDVGWGFFLFKEKDIIQRLPAAAIMVIGAVLIVVS